MLLPHYQQLLSSQLDHVLEMMEQVPRRRRREGDLTTAPPEFLAQAEQFQHQAQCYLLKLLYHAHLCGYLPATEDKGRTTIARDWLEPWLLTPFLKWQQRQLWLTANTEIQARGWKFLWQLLEGLRYEFCVQHISSPHKIWQLTMHLAQSDLWEKRSLVNGDSGLDLSTSSSSSSSSSSARTGWVQEYGAPIMAWLEPSLLALYTAFHSYPEYADHQHDNDEQDDASSSTLLPVGDREILLEQEFFKRFMDMPSAFFDNVLSLQPGWQEEELLEQIQDPRAKELAGVIWNSAQQDGNTVRVFNVVREDERDNAAELGVAFAFEGLDDSQMAMQEQRDFENGRSFLDPEEEILGSVNNDTPNYETSLDDEFSFEDDDLDPRCENDDYWPRERYHLDEYPDVWEQLVVWTNEHFCDELEEPVLTNTYYDHLFRHRNLGSSPKKVETYKDSDN
mmetsp:Transcript_21649/g.60087  ORF Transcript_21649/g.60087 Transcript_21649/m.60087 type:complete len:450 (+) Transcript_21649:597-1946(+)